MASGSRGVDIGSLPIFAGICIARAGGDCATAGAASKTTDRYRHLACCTPKCHEQVAERRREGAGGFVVWLPTA